MKERKIGIRAVGIAAVLLLILAAAGFSKPDRKGTGIQNTEELGGKVLGGIRAARMEGEHAEVLFETILGVKLSGYREADSIDELLYELRSGRVDAICCPDVTAEYLLKTEAGLKRLAAPEDTSESVEGGGRLAFGFAMEEDDAVLCQKINAGLAELSADGTLKALQVAYVEANEPLKQYASGKGTGKKLYVGVTGTVPPLDCLDGDGVPYGFSVALLEELGKRTGYRFVAVPVKTEESFTALRSGRVDMLFCYGTGRNTSPTKKDYLMSDGYYTMMEYAYLTLE